MYSQSALSMHGPIHRRDEGDKHSATSMPPSCSNESGPVTVTADGTYERRRVHGQHTYENDREHKLATGPRRSSPSRPLAAVSSGHRARGSSHPGARRVRADRSNRPSRTCLVPRRTSPVRGAVTSTARSRALVRVDPGRAVHRPPAPLPTWPEPTQAAPREELAPTDPRPVPTRASERVKPATSAAAVPAERHRVHPDTARSDRRTQRRGRPAAPKVKVKRKSPPSKSATRRATPKVQWPEVQSP